MIRLVTADGRRVADVESMQVELMAANGKPPEVVIWGERIFRRDDHWDDPLLYAEGMAYVVLPTDRVSL